MKYVEQEKPVTTAHEKLGKIEFKIEVGQVENQEEMVNDAGGIEKLIAFYNGSRATNAKNAARASARNYEVAEGTDPSTYAAIIASISTEGQRIAKNYSPSVDLEQGPSKTKKAAAFDSIAALVGSGQEFTKEQLLQLLANAK